MTVRPNTTVRFSAEYENGNESMFSFCGGNLNEGVLSLTYEISRGDFYFNNKEDVRQKAHDALDAFFAAEDEYLPSE